jgi:hypothetical protein
VGELGLVEEEGELTAEEAADAALLVDVAVAAMPAVAGLDEAGGEDVDDESVGREPAGEAVVEALGGGVVGVGERVDEAGQLRGARLRRWFGRSGRRHAAPPG